MAKLPRKEESAIKREMTRMQKNFSGIADMGGLPSAMFVVDVNHHKIAVAEAARAGIPCVGIVDTNSDPTTVSHPIPGNDDAVKSIRIIVEAVTAAVQNGLAQRDTRRAQRGQAELMSATAGVEAVAAEPSVAAVGDDDVLAKVDLPADVAAVVEGEVEGTAGVPKKKPLRAKRPAVKAE
jgi:small subunit ribosomal protein S2